jgi:alginate O-acetyltransferase complex protein AlgJ
MTTVDSGTAPDAQATGPREEAEPAERGKRRHPRAPQRPIALVLAAVFFFAPAVSFLGGERPREFENRRLSAFPSLSDGWAFFGGFTSWAIDRLPLRDDAVRGNAALSERAFGEPPSYGSNSAPVAGIPGVGAPEPTGAASGPRSVVSDRIVQGENGWLYLGSDFTPLCDPAWTITQTLARANRLARAVEASGRRFVLTVAPNKSTVWPYELPATYRDKECAAQRREAFWYALRSSPPTGYLDLLGPIEAEQTAAGRPAYRKIDTHWGDPGAVVYATELAEHLQPGLTRGTNLVQEGTAPRPGDLSAVLGLPEVEDAPVVRVDRPGVTRGPETDVPGLSGQPQRVVHSTTGVPLFRPRTVLLGDSFTHVARSKVVPFFADLTMMRFDTNTRTMGKAMLAADVVVVEIVERSLNGGSPPILSPGNVDALVAMLRANPRR